MKSIATLLITIFSLLAPLMAAEKPASPAEITAYQTKLFKYMDEDGDGKLTRREFVVIVLYTCFEDMKPDKNGRLSKEQFIKTFGEETNAQTEWAMMDSDRDGLIVFEDAFKNKISIKELEAEFRELDKNNKGYVTLAEVRALKP